MGLVYCDFKPDNIIQVGDAVKLIDLGGVRRIDDLDSPIYGTVGYQAPEVPRVGPSVASDIYTIGRTLMVLAMEFRGYQCTYVASLPPVSATPLFQQHDSLYRLLAKACAPDPADRFASADELRVQLLGVLREVVAAGDGQTGAAQHSTSSLLFDSPRGHRRAAGLGPPAHAAGRRQRPAGRLAAHRQRRRPGRPAGRARRRRRTSSAEVLLATGRAALEAGRTDIVAAVVRDMLADDPWEWRAVWLSGLAALGADDAAGAQAAFNAVYGQVPGELAPKLALALACETSGELDVAESLYATCARTDANYIAPAAFGLARIRGRRGDLDGALAALDLVPPTSRAFTSARRQRAGLLADSGRGLPALAEAMGSIDSLTIEPVDRATPGRRRAAGGAGRGAGRRPRAGHLDRRAAGGGAGPARRARGRLPRAGRPRPHPAERVRLVDEANAVRRWSLR